MFAFANFFDKGNVESIVETATTAAGSAARTAIYSHDSRNRLVRIDLTDELAVAASAPPDETIHVLDWADVGLPTRLVRENQLGRVVTQRTYDGRGTTRSESTTIYNTSNTVEFAGGVRTVSNASGPWHVDRAETFDATGAAMRVLFDSVELDAAGRVDQFFVPGPDVTRTHTYDGAVATGESLVSADNTTLLQRTLTHDAAGRLRTIEQLSASGGAVTQHLGWGLEGRLHGEWLGINATELPSEGRVRIAEHDRMGRFAAELEETTSASWAASAVADSHTWAAPPALSALRTESRFGRTPLGTLTGESTDGASSWTATTGTDEASLATVNASPVVWDALGRFTSYDGGPTPIAATGWTSDNLPRTLTAGTGSAAITETRRHDALGRVVAVTTTVGATSSTAYRTWFGAMLVDETWSNGWQRQWHPSSDLHRPLGYTLRCTMSGSSCEAAPLGVDTSAVVFVVSAGEQHATFWLAQDFGLDVVAVLDASGALIESYDTTTYGHRRIYDASDTLVCNDAVDSGCGSQVGNPLGHAGALWSSVVGVYEMRARVYSPAMRVFLSPDPLGYVDSFDRWLYVGGDPFGFVDPFGLKMENANSKQGGAGGNPIANLPRTTPTPPPAGPGTVTTRTYGSIPIQFASRGNSPRDINEAAYDHFRLASVVQDTLTSIPSGEDIEVLIIGLNRGVPALSGGELTRFEREVGGRPNGISELNRLKASNAWLNGNGGTVVDNMILLVFPPDHDPARIAYVLVNERANQIGQTRNIAHGVHEVVSTAVSELWSVLVTQTAGGSLADARANVINYHAQFPSLYDSGIDPQFDSNGLTNVGVNELESFINHMSAAAPSGQMTADEFWTAVQGYWP